MKTIYLAGPLYTTLVVEIEKDGASLAGWGKGVGEYFGIALTDNERLLLAAALLRPGERVKRLNGDVSEVKRRT